MPGKRNDAEGNTADREMALTQITSAGVIVLLILFWAATLSPGNRSIRFSIQGSFGGDFACVGSEGECAEMIRTAIPPEFDDPKQVSLRWWPKRLTTMIDGMDVRTGRAWGLVMHAPDYPNKGACTEAVSHERPGYELTSGKRGVPAMQVEMMATFGKEGKAQLTMRMVFVSSRTAGDEEETEGGWRTAA